MPHRRILAAVVILGLIAYAMWQFQPDRRLRRSWHALIQSVQARHARALGGLLAEDYSDRWGYTRTTIVSDARLAFQQFESLGIRVEQQQLQINRDQATITATLRVEARGTDRAVAARTAANAIYSPYVFEWRREHSFPWKWKLVRFDQPELDLDRFRRGVATGF